jgi:hypothetical protein
MVAPSRLLYCISLAIILHGCASSDPKPTEPVPPVVSAPAECPQLEPPQCPEPAASKSVPGTDLTLIGEVEQVLVSPPEVLLQARIDTGATTTSVNALEIEPFERDGKPWVRFVLVDDQDQSHPLERPVTRTVMIKRHGAASVERQVVELVFELAGHKIKAEASLTDRSDFSYKLLIGRNFLKGLFAVDVRHKNLHQSGQAADKSYSL